MKPAVTVAAVFLCAIAILHLVRIVMGVAITVGSTEIPIWVSAFGIVVPGAIAVGLWRSAKGS